MQARMLASENVQPKAHYMEERVFRKFKIGSVKAWEIRTTNK